MALSYPQMRDYLDSRSMTHEMMQEHWDLLKPVNWKVAALDKEGLNWTDLTEPALDSLIKLARQEKERNS